MGLKRFQHLCYQLMKDPELDTCLPSTGGRGTSAPKVYVGTTNTRLGVYDYGIIGDSDYTINEPQQKENADGST